MPWLHCSNKSVFSNRLNWPYDSPHSLRLGGRLFQTCGPAAGVATFGGCGLCPSLETRLKPWSRWYIIRLHNSMWHCDVFYFEECRFSSRIVVALCVSVSTALVTRITVTYDWYTRTCPSQTDLSHIYDNPVTLNKAHSMWLETEPLGRSYMTSRVIWRWILSWPWNVSQCQWMASPWNQVRGRSNFKVIENDAVR